MAGIFLFEKRNVAWCHQRSVNWIKNNSIPQKGIIVNSFHKSISHIEVTGYLIPTLIVKARFTKNNPR